MVQSGGCSNHDLERLVRSLASETGTRRRRTAVRGGWSDGRREFGSVSAAILEVLRSADGEMKACDVRRAVEMLLRGSVSRHTVSDFLITQAGSPDGLVERVRHAHYRLRRIPS